MSILRILETFLLNFAQKVPLELFAFLGSIVEEIVAPIPSPLVMVTAGTIANAQNLGIIYLFWIASIAAVGKTLGCWIFYFLADKAEDLVFTKYGKMIGISHKEIENIGKHFNGTLRDNLILIFLRALPIMPSTPISLACGFIKMKIKSFIISTLIGTFIRSLMFIYIGYSGLAIFRSLIEGINSLESLLNYVFVAVFIVILAVVYYKRGKSDLVEILKKKLK